MKVQAAQLIDLLVSMGVTTASDWAQEPGKLQAKISQDGGITRYSADDGAYTGSPEHFKLYEEIAAAQVRGEAIEVDETKAEPAAAPKKRDPKPKAEATEGAEAEAPKKRGRKPKAETATVAVEEKPAKRGRPKKDGRPPADASYKVWQKYLAENPIKPTDRGPGIMRTVIRELKHAANLKEKGISKAALLQTLKVEFPDRDPGKMQTNLSNLMPNRLKAVYGIHAWRRKNEEGVYVYWIEGEGNKPQPEVVEPVAQTSAPVEQPAA